MKKVAIWLGVWVIFFAFFFGISVKVIGAVTRWTALSLPVVIVGFAVFALLVSGALTAEAYNTFNPRRRGR